MTVRLVPSDLTELAAAPATPGAGLLRFYAKSDHKVYIKDSTGAETDITTPGGGGTVAFVTLAKWGTD
jgi:hypothetical protein